MKAGVLLHPRWLAVAGKPAGPSRYHLLQVAGNERVMARLDNALAAFG